MVLILPPGDFGAYLFDCDGTIVDSMPVHHRAWCAALDEWGCELPEDLFYAWGGRPVADIIVDLNERHGLDMPVDAVARRREEAYQSFLPELTAVPEVLAHLEDAYGRVPFAVVSGSTRESVTASLAALGLLEKFETLVCAGDYARAKPDPECFLLGARRLGVPPERCLVFEDTDLGVQAATAAGMAAVRVPMPWERAGTA
ncbi:HAD family hydrolase [Micromonospora auratinigra]|uniref:Haloacid dehalogenase superfamily, subfamily IA, variant 3 with third motif having DD or ED n=1 Tax=Micromonospora auratinigra TaxID=261654 RepID=A0A1A8Z273_9ACTN|nr:HAD family phosphatase [Micromonospora auratinigra]SBT37862.1 haloacid dehalogenase superfamily, subfamily IA, variant 3 with third motif having DD or ED [Micromonospora auratinigra]